MTCPKCKEATVETPNGIHLNPRAGRLGRLLKDGTELSADEIRNPAIRGYYPHHCPPASKTTTKQSSQDSLF